MREIPEFLCLTCNHQFLARNPNINAVRQCPACRSYGLIEMGEIEVLAKEAVHMIDTTLFGITPLLDVLASIFKRHGFKYRAPETMNLMNRVWAKIKQIEPKLKVADIAIHSDVQKRSIDG